MSKVLTQNDLPQIISDAVAMEETAKAITGVMGSIVKFIDKVDVKQIEQGDKKMATMSKVMKSYGVIINDIVNTLTSAHVDEKSLAEICGKINETEKQDDGTVKKVTKWTNLDALLQITNIVSGLIKGIAVNDRVEKLGIFGRRKLRRDVRLSVELAMYAFTTMKNELLTIGDAGMIKDLMEVLVDGPEIVEEMSTHKDESEATKDDEKKKIFDRTEKVTKKGKVGLITAMKNVFDLLKMMLELEPPGIIGITLFKVKIQIFGKMIQIAIDEFSKILTQIATDELLKNTVKACKVISGTGKEGEDGIMGIVTSMMSIIELIKGFPNPTMISKKIEMIGKLFDKIINELISIFIDPKTFKPKEAIEKLISKDFTDILEKIKDSTSLITDVINDLSGVATALIKAGAMAFLALPGTLIMGMFLYALKFLIKILTKALEDIDGEKLKNIDDNLKNVDIVLKTIVSIELKILAGGALAILAIAACMLVGIFVFALIGLVWVLDKSFDIIAKLISRDMKKDIQEFARILKTMIYIEIAIILLGFGAMYALKSMFQVALFIIALIPFVLVVNFAFDIIAELINRDMKADIKEFTMMLLKLLLIQAALFIVALFVPMTLKSMLSVGLFLLGLIVFAFVLKMVLKVIDKIINRETKSNMRELVLILVALVIIETIILIMGAFAVKASLAALQSLIFLISLMLFVLIVKLVVKIIDKLIKNDTRNAVIELAIILLALVAIEIIIIIMGSMAIKALTNAILSIVFLVVLIAFVAIVKVLMMVIDKLINKSMQQALIEVIIIIALLLAIEIMMIIMGAMAVKAMIGALKGVIFLVVLLVFIALLGALGYLLNSYGAMLTGPAIAGLAQVLLIIGLVVACAALLIVLGNMWDSMNVAGIIGVLATLMIAFVMLAIVGVLALAAAIALPGMAIAMVTTLMLLAVVALLKKVQDIELTTKVTKPIFAALAGIGAMIVVGMAGIGAIVALAFMPMNIALCGMFYGVATKLNDIAHFDLDAKKLKKKISDSKSVLNYIKSAFGGFSFSWRQKRKAEKALSAMTSILNPVKDILRKLNRIAKMKLDQATIIKNIELVFMTVDKIEEKIDKLTQVPKKEDGSIDWKAMLQNTVENAIKAAAARGKMNRTDRILVKVLDITKKLKKIADLDIDTATCLKNIDLVFTTVDKIQEKIDKLTEIPKKDDGSIDWKNMFKSTVENAIKAAAARGKMNRTDRILAKVYDITNKLKSIADLKIDTDILEKNLQSCFDAVDRIEKFINKRNELPNGEQRGIVGMFMNSIEESLKAAAANGSLKRTDKILGSVHNIVKTLESIQNVKVNTKTITTKLEEIFAAVDTIDGLIEKRSNMSEAEKLDWWSRIKNRIAAAEKAKMQEEQAKDLDRISTIMTNVSTITKTLKEIMDIKVDPNKAQQKTEKVLNSIEAIYMQICGKLTGGGWFDAASSQKSGEVIVKVCEELNMLNSSLSGLSGISDKAVANTGKTLDHYSNFLTKIDGLKVENLEKSVNMFSQMARFSESISGNFEAMARSIEEKLMPTLEELRDLVEELPEAIEKSSENMVSAVDKMGETTTTAAKSAGDNMAAAAKSQSDSASQIRQIGSKIDKLTKTLTGGDVKVKIKP